MSSPPRFNLKVLCGPEFEHWLLTSASDETFSPVCLYLLGSDVFPVHLHFLDALGRSEGAETAAVIALPAPFPAPFSHLPPLPLPSPVSWEV